MLLEYLGLNALERQEVSFMHPAQGFTLHVKLPAAPPCLALPSPALPCPALPSTVSQFLPPSLPPLTNVDSSGIQSCLQCVRLLQVDFQKKEAELFAPHSLPPWFTWDTKLGSLTLHFEAPQVFAAEVYPKDMGLQVFWFLYVRLPSVA